ncbi:hypothetical protein [Pseudooceanicola algae]|uniref:hypothetical protein n=1 Tax=Pseudooceanicola algae TaxID=1537215 RepID=UPI001E2F853C|nr:hypothetical protein [Pseudooceanicola algae]
MTGPGPELVFPPQEAEAVRLAYAEAEAILEYGAGGSTMLAVAAGTPIVSVESDAGWVYQMRGWIRDSAPTVLAEVIHADIGPTGDWGYPRDASGWKDYAAYPLKVWDRLGQDLPLPDVVLVDGRFRTGCALATAFRSPRPVTLLFDDYKDRPRYHEIEGFLGAPTLIGRLAVFDVTPMAIPADRLLDIQLMLTHP